MKDLNLASSIKHEYWAHLWFRSYKLNHTVSQDILLAATTVFALEPLCL